jgi:hypothetical protein
MIARHCIAKPVDHRPAVNDGYRISSHSFCENL